MAHNIVAIRVAHKDGEMAIFTKVTEAFSDANSIGTLPNNLKTGSRRGRTRRHSKGITRTRRQRTTRKYVLHIMELDITYALMCCNDTRADVFSSFNASLEIQDPGIRKLAGVCGIVGESVSERVAATPSDITHLIGVQSKAITASTCTAKEYSRRKLQEFI